MLVFIFVCLLIVVWALLLWILPRVEKILKKKSFFFLTGLSKEILSSAWTLLSDKPKEYIVFTSFGDNHNIEKYWNSDPKKKSFDIMGVYYGDRVEPPVKKKTFSVVYKRKGGKFQNFCHFYNHNNDIFKKYKYIAIWDDDIIINTLQINEMFKIMKEYRLTIGMPSFSDQGKISHWITKHKPDRLLTFTNFIEMNVPIFDHSVLPMLTQASGLSVCTLTGYGIDHIYMNLLQNKNHRFAVVHKIVCINPHDNHKTDKKREIDKLQPTDQRKKAYEDIRKKTGIHDIEFIEYQTIANDQSRRRSTARCEREHRS